MRTTVNVQANERISLPTALCEAMGGIEHGDVVEIAILDVRTPPINRSEPEAGP